MKLLVGIALVGVGVGAMLIFIRGVQSYLIEWFGTGEEKAGGIGLVVMVVTATVIQKLQEVWLSWPD